MSILQNMSTEKITKQIMLALSNGNSLNEQVSLKAFVKKEMKITCKGKNPFRLFFYRLIIELADCAHPRFVLASTLNKRCLNHKS